MTHIDVGTRDELIAAWAAQAGEDVEIAVHAMIAMGGVGLPPIANGHALTITFDGGAGLDAEAAIGGAYDDRNLIQYRGRALIVQGGSLKNHNRAGAALRVDSPELLEVVDTRFEGCGDAVYRPRSRPIRTSADVVFSQCISAFSPLTEVRCRDLTFVGCSTGDGSYSHGIYCTTRSVLVRGCRWTGCGSPLALYGVDGVVVDGCTFEDPALANKSRTGWHKPYFFILNNGPARVTGCRLTGAWDYYVIGHAPRNPGEVVFEGNDLREATFERWSGWWGEPSWTRDQWLAAGQDAGTQMPAVSPA